ncbi:excinuclease ABC subunit C [Halorubrum ezzemoulense]|nr:MULTISPECIES: excinuclease ABC subunit C [Halorubrum]MDB2239786.1 excinuclease ABC subunit C [Halorubrum ezzemoulense]MDB2244263.1 excinuclease ABC subunit C [Halorubrum ezzemoulense]MDB2252291.1 excinuclease ABC subunit C [Halorubrum ezzemoulense]MDB2277998.1 excinuclease ABC subunit C [Halorubrum ezzemoulense]MDB2281396.1 excinuclease ABC subunit C [Halorubrum ezzemoulense]
MDAGAVRERARDLPTEPGVYQFRAGETTLYVGKALDLRDRVRSYADPRSGRIRGMVERADRVEFAVTDTETQALLLEANLIKRLRPRYNVRLKDDKSYPLVAFSDHEVPRIEVTRDPEAGAVAYGPFTDVGRVETVVKAVRDEYRLRGCSDHKYEGRDRPCLDYEMGICSAPCTGEISPEAYAEDVAAARRFFEGETGVLADPLRRRMEAAAEANEFERAANLRDRLEAVEAFHGEGGEAVSDRNDDRTVDVLAAAVEGDTARVARLHSERGQLVDRSRHQLDAAAVADAAESGASGGDATPADPDANTPAAVLSAFLAQYYAEREFPDAVLLAERPADRDVVDWLEREGVAVRVPGAGREAKLVELALKNARKRGGRDDPVGALGDRLGIARPERVEGFDVSHAQGTAVVGSDVCFVDGSAETADYRRKKLTERNDDYANMRELVRWRAERALAGEDDRPDPDLLLIDGGEGQLGAARDALAETGWDVPVVALAKAEELVVTPTGTRRWDDDAPELHLLQRVRDEAHRFAVSYHQTVRDEVRTVLDDVPGVGPETRRRLLRRFGSVENVRDASRDDLTDVDGVGDATADTLRERL